MPTLHRRAAPLLALVLAACSGGFSDRETVRGSGTAASETRDVEGFRRVSFALPGQLTVTRGEPASLEITADDNVLPRIRARVRDGVLEIDAERADLRASTPIRVRLVAPALEGVIAAGSGSVEAPGMRGEEVTVTVAGSGDVRAPGIEAARVRIDVAGSGDAVVAGRAARQTISVAGSGDVDARELAGEAADVTIAGSGTARVHADRRLNASIVGSGSVLYRGDPEVTLSRVGSGSVRRMD